MFNVEGKSQAYDLILSTYLNVRLETVLNSFIKYSKQDTLCLLKARPILQRL